MIARRPTAELTRSGVRAGWAAALALACLVTPRVARAQLHWDASARVGVAKRFLEGAQGGDARVGPAAELSAHLSLLPLVRVGAYVDHDTSPQGGDAPARRFFGAGLRVKLLSPFPSGRARVWLFLRGGGLFALAPGYETTLEVRDTPQSAPARRPFTVEGASGRAVDLGGGVGASYKLWGPWHVSLELGARAPVALSGDLYEGRALAPGGGVLAPAGQDRLVTTLTAGITYDP